MLEWKVISNSSPFLVLTSKQEHDLDEESDWHYHISDRERIDKLDVWYVVGNEPWKEQKFVEVECSDEDREDFSKDNLWWRTWFTRNCVESAKERNYSRNILNLLFVWFNTKSSWSKKWKENDVQAMKERSESRMEMRSSVMQLMELRWMWSNHLATDWLSKLSLKSFNRSISINERLKKQTPF